MTKLLFLDPEVSWFMGNISLVLCILPQVYANLATCFAKLEQFNEGLKAADQCIILNPTFMLGFSRKV